MRFALNENGWRVEINSATEGGHYRCPLCHKDVIQKRGEIRTHHFAHKQYDGCIDDWSYDESSWHDHWTKQFPNDNAEFILCHGTLKHFADIYIPERKLVVEFRHDYLTKPDFERRNSYFAATGNQVIWVFDFSEEYTSHELGKRENHPDYFEMQTPPSIFKKPLGDIEIFFQIKNANHPYRGRLVKLGSSNYDLGTFIFSSAGIYTEDDFVDYVMKGITPIDHFGFADLSDPLIAFAYRDQRQVVYFCPRGAKSLFDRKECSYCEWHGSPTSDGRQSCRKRFESLYEKDIDYIKNLSRGKEGRIEKVTFIENGQEKTFEPSPIKPLGHSMMTWWKDYQPKIAIFRNIDTQVEIKITNDPAINIQKYHHVFGHYKVNEVFETNARQVPDALDPVWVIAWFK